MVMLYGPKWEANGPERHQMLTVHCDHHGLAKNLKFSIFRLLSVHITAN